MNALPRNPNRVAWIKREPKRPLCCVPWIGTTAVLSDGSVNFCCYSSAVVGNVNRDRLDDIWHGPIMRQIRQELAQQRFPPECRSPSCPVYRGDEQADSYFSQEGPHCLQRTGTEDPHAHIRERLHGSGLKMNRNEQLAGNSAELILEFQYRGEPIDADLVVAVENGDGEIRFLPDHDDFAGPLLRGVEMNEACSPLRIPVFGQSMKFLVPSEPFLISAALFASGSNLNQLSNCYWSDCKTIGTNATGLFEIFTTREPNR